MDLTLNGVYSPGNYNMLTFTDVPNILKIEEDIAGTYATFTFTFTGNLKSTVTSDGQYYVTFLDETVTNVMKATNAKNKRFYIASDNISTAASFCNALRSCPSLVANFTITQNGPSVTLKGRIIGQLWSNFPNYIDKNIPSTYLVTNGTDGTANSSLFGAKVMVNVLSGSSVYVTTLEKNFYGNECAFDVSPVLSTFAEYGKANNVQMTISSIGIDGTYSNRGSVTAMVTPGYQANQSDRYMYMSSSTILLNTNRNQVRYVYGQTIPFSVLASGSLTITYTVKNSTMATLTSSTETVSYGKLHDHEYTIPLSVYSNASFVDIAANNKTWRFKVIKPLKATKYYQRILWRNEYGGIEFFDFTGKRSESDSVDIETYEKNIFDFYSNPAYELKKIYSNDYKKQVKVTSHLLEADGRWFANSLMRSKKVWTVINGKTHYIIPKNISVDENGTYNNIYTVELTYEYSQLS